MSYYRYFYYSSYFDVEVPICYFSNHFSDYFEICEEQRAFFGGHFYDPNKPIRYIKREIPYDRHELRKQLEALLFPRQVAVPGRATPKQPIQPEAPVIQVIRRPDVKPIRIPDARPEMRRLFRIALREAIAHRKEVERLKKKKKKRDLEALLLLWQ